MRTAPWIGKIGHLGLRGALAASLFFSSQFGWAQEKKVVLLSPPKKEIGAVPIRAWDLKSYRHIALEKQPALQAYRASLDAAQSKARALDNLKVPPLVRRDLPVRRAQAKKGVLAASAQLQREEAQTLYSVTRLYLSAQYAEEQLAITKKVLQPADKLEGLRFLKGIAERIVKTRKVDPDSARPDVAQWDVDWIDSLIEQVESLQVEAQQGQARALLALREAAGIEPCTQLVLPSGTKMPRVDPHVDRELILQAALSRNPALTQAQVGVDVTGLEIDAQNALTGLTGETFAAGSDLHSIVVPQGNDGENYRPGAIGLEMPTTIVGSKKARVEQVSALHTRARAVQRKIQGLIALEAENAYLKWAEAHQKVKYLEKAVELAQKSAEGLKPKFDSFDPENGYPRFRDLLEATTRASLTEVKLNQARYAMLLALADLERITVGGFCVDWELAPVAEKAEAKTDKNDGGR